MDRRGFLAAMLAAPLFCILGRSRAAAAEKQEQRLLVLQQSPLAGFQFYAGERLWPDLAVGQGLTLHREPDNRHDPQAVAVYRGAHKLGFVPRAENTAVAGLLDQRAALQARIINLRRSRDPWERVRIEILFAAPWRRERGAPLNEREG